MAHVAKYNRGALGHMLKHYERAKDEKGEYVKFGNEDIDINKTHLNYNLGPKHSNSDYRFITEKCSELNCLTRKNINVMCSWVVTMPKDLDEKYQKEFFQESYNFLQNRYGEKNVVSSFVHLDEKTPHMHFSFTPVVFDKVKNKEKFSAKECVNRTDLKSFHADLDKHLEKTLGIKVNVLNDLTKEGNKSIEELKRGSAIEKLQEIEKQLKSIQAQLAPLKAEYEAKKAYIRQAEKDSDISMMYPDYATVTKKGLLHKEEFVTVPKEKWEEKHISANHVSAVNREYEVLEKMIKEFKNTSEDLRDIDRLKKENKSLKFENYKLEHVLKSKDKEINRLSNTLERIEKDFPSIAKTLEKSKTVIKNRDMER